MNKQTIDTTKAPAAIGPYSQAIIADNMIFVSGQIPLNPQTGQMVEGNIEEQTHRVMQNIDAILKDYNEMNDLSVLAYILDSGFKGYRNYTDEQLMKELEERDISYLFGEVDG